MSTKKRRGRGEGAIYQNSNGLWCTSLTIGYDDQGKRRRRVVYGKTKRDVQKKLFELQSASITGTLSSPQQIRVSVYLNRWLEDVCRPTIKRGTYVRYETLIRLYISPNIGGIQLINLQPSQVQYLYSRLENDDVSARTRQLVHVILHSALKQALKWGYVTRNVCVAVNRPKVPKKQMVCLNQEQAAKFLLIAQQDRNYALYVLAITSGLRQGELFGLRWEDIDLKMGTVSIQRTVYEHKGEIDIGEPKTAKSRRCLDLPKIAISALKAHREQLFSKGHHDTWVFCDNAGGIIRRSNFLRRSFKPLLKKAELPDIRFHDLRHTAATLMLSQNIHPKVVQERLGHSQIAITLDTYSHVLPSMQKEATDKMDAMFAAVA